MIQMRLIALVIGIVLLNANEEMIFIPGIKTFRDLVEKIIEKKFARQ